MKISIRWALILACLGLIWGTQILITTSTYLSSQKVLIGHARDIMQNISDLTKEQSQNHLALAQGAAHLTKRLISSNVVGSDLARHDVLEQYFLNQLAIYSHFAGIYVGLPNGDFFYVNRSDVQVENGYRTKEITHVDGIKRTRLVWRDAAQNYIREEMAPADTYNPRQRPWYQKAMTEKKIVWTDPYIFFTSQKPGITIAGPIYNSTGRLQAIVGVDIEIDQLSTFIGRLRIGKNGRAFMINNNGDVVAFPDVDKIKFNEPDQEGKFRLVKINELDDGLTQAAYHAVAWEYNDQERIELKAARFARFEHNGQTYHAVFTPFAMEQWPWIIGVYLPESDYLGTIQENRRFNLMLTLGLSILATVIGLLMARGVIRPLAGLEKEALAIKRNRMDQHFDTRSIFKEIQETADSFALMKEDIRRGEDKYRGIFENIQDVYYEAAIDGRILEISPSVHKVSEYTREELLGANIKRLYKNPAEREAVIAALIAEGQVTDYELSLIGKDGRIENCSINSSIKYDATGKPQKIVGSMRVITDRKKAEMEVRRYQEHLEVIVQERTRELEKINRQLRDQMVALKTKEEELQESEEKYRSIIENMDDGYYEVEVDGHITFCNDHLAEIFGYERDQMMGLNLRSFMEANTDEAAKKRYAKIWRGEGSERLARYTIVRPDGRGKSLDASVSAITDPAGNNIGFRGVVIDVTDRLNAEKEKQKLETRLQQIQRLEGIGTLAGGVAHDFNNLLMGIQGNVSLMLMEFDDDDDHWARLKSIESCVKAGSDLTSQLLGFARGGKYIVKPLDFNQVIKNTAQMFGRTRKEIIIHEKTDSGLWSVMADRNQMEQVLLNLYINAWQAMPDGGHLYIKTENTVVEEDFANTFEITAGRYVQVSVSDTGTGMDETIQERIFEPFFTTKEIGRGTGMGLASVFGIIKNHGGAIDFASRLGEGTTFYIYLPASDAKPAPDYKSRQLRAFLDDVPAKGSEVILLVDDEKVILEVNQPMLEKLGYEVLIARGGIEAVEKYRRHHKQIALVILDMIMPDMGGGEVFDRIIEIKANARVLLSTGYSLLGQAEEILARGCAGVIQKPFNINQLAAKIREVLDAVN